MGKTAFTVDLKDFRKIFAKCKGQEPRRLAEEVISGKEIAALFSQAIAANFEAQGPGWQPLKPQTIRMSVSKAIRKRLEPVKSGRKVTGYTVRGSTMPARKILQHRGVLKKAATTPGADGHVQKVQGTTIEWGLNLPYAGIHQRGGTINNPGSDHAWGIKGLKTKAHKIVIPARPYLRLSAYWYAEISAKVLDMYAKKVALLLKGDT